MANEFFPVHKSFSATHAKTPDLPPVLPELLDKDTLDVTAYNGASDEEEVELQPGQVPGNGETSAQDGQPEVGLIGEGGASVAPETAMDLEAIPEGDQLRQQSSSSFPASHAGVSS